MTRSQKRTFNQLLIFLIILALLLTIALLVRRRTEAKDTDADSSTPTQTEQPQGPAITALSWNNGDTFQSFSTAEDGTWRWDGDQEFPLDTAVLNEIINALSPITPVKTISAGDTLSAYGLENSGTVLTVGYQDSTFLQLTFGAQVPGGTDCYMLRSDDTATVYVMNSTIPEAMNTAVYDMMALPELPATEAPSSISLQSAGNDLQITSPNGTTWLCNGADISDSERLTNLVEALSSLTLDRCENFKPSADGLALWGMDAPAVTAQIHYSEDQLLTLQIGSRTLDGSGYYVRVNDDTTIYSIDTYTLEPIITAAQQGFAPDAAPAADTADNAASAQA